jgi:hypothetical protein
MSRADLLLACQWWVGREGPPEKPGRAAVFGTAVHAAVANGFLGLRSNESPEAEERAGAIRSALLDYFREEGWEGKLLIERSVAVLPSSRLPGRFISAPDAAHVYLDALPGELPGTVDLAVDGKDLLVLDHKTGKLPAEGGQLKSLAVALARPEHGRIVVGYVHAPWGKKVRIHPAEASREELAEHRWRLALALAGVGIAGPTPGEHCKALYCPARFSCPVGPDKYV